MAPNDSMPVWATIAGYDDAFWPEPGETYYRESIPQVGERSMLRYAAAETMPASVWLLYRWWNLECNGWGSIEDVENTAVVWAQLDPIPGFEPKRVCSALPIKVLRVPDLLQLPPQTKEISFWKDSFGRLLESTLDIRSRRTSYYRFGPYHVVDFNVEGDAGMWMIFHEAGSAISALLGCDWSTSARYFYAGHGRLTNADADHLRELTSPLT